MIAHNEELRVITGREGDFENFEKIGRGGFASVYRCQHKIDQKNYALKKIKINSEKDGEQMKNLSQEVKELSALYHPNIVRYYGCWISSDESVKQSALHSHKTSKNASLLSSPSHSFDHRSKDSYWNDDGDSSQVSLDEDELQLTSPHNRVKWRRKVKDYDVSLGPLQESRSPSNLSNFEKREAFKNIKPIKLPDQRLDKYYQKKQNPGLVFNEGKTREKIEFFIQTELCDETLKDYIKRRNSKNVAKELREEDIFIAFELAKQLVKGLSYLKDMSILHRDIKPSNIFVSNENNLKIGDFGLVKQCRSFALQPSPIESPLKLKPDDQSTDWELKDTEEDSVEIWNIERSENLFDIEPEVKARPIMRKYTSVNQKDNPNGPFSGKELFARARSKSMYCGNEEFTSNIGTRLYASPEQTDSKYYSFETDHFSAALVILELFFPIYTEMQRIKVLTQARKNKLPNQLKAQYPNLFKALTSLLDLDPFKRFDIRRISNLVSMEELDYRKKTKYTNLFLYREEEGEEFKPRHVLIKGSTLFIYKELEDTKAESIYNIEKFHYQLFMGVFKLKSEFVKGCEIQDYPKEKGEGEPKRIAGIRELVETDLERFYELISQVRIVRKSRQGSQVF